MSRRARRPPLDPLRELNYNGASFRIAYPTDFEGSMHDKHINASEQSGDLLNDTSLERCRAVEELLNVNFDFYPQSARTVLKEVSQSVLGGVDSYVLLQIASAHENFITLIQSGGLYNLRKVPYLNLDEDYFYGHINEPFKLTVSCISASPAT